MEGVTSLSSAKMFKIPLPVVKCYHCNEDLESDGIGCSTCDAWAHKKCVYMNALPKKDVNRVNWICRMCMDKWKAALPEESTYMDKLEELRKSM